MKVLYCDVCKDAIENPIAERNYFHITDFDICEPCKDNLERAAKPTMRAKKPFDYRWYGDLTLNLLREGRQKGKIEVKAKR
jgi:hypothetical protein